ncbi:LapA family protein [Gloeocapsopsis crepidinum LEGE 06123]|uniref:LapA family protein n=1 Tax=Gloeocapsopsis crepidinum LEGE 06123 TaxID=588587 RepID=A0ABR9UZ07_9CHRO|nr:LapA family protein [Gloeocapsopsis crepidinum]MBE9192760.1 LapA family protein [Gloeocapsopsis crepidinum LEGE 06123]
MKTLANLLTIVILAGWVVAIAIISVQNATPVSLRFLTFQSIQLPAGLVLAFSAALGMLAMASTQPLWIAGSRRNSLKSDDDEFFVDE